MLLLLVVTAPFLLLWAALRDGGPHETPITADTTAATATAAPHPRDVAEVKRQEAFSACDTELWAECTRLLDEAQRLDPAGGSELRVQAARQRAYLGETRPTCRSRRTRTSRLK